MTNHTTSTLPKRFRDPDALARFIVENEWALDSEVNPSGLADWEETLRRVFDSWDANTPDDILAAIAAAVRLDRSFRIPLSLDVLRTAWENAEQADECREGDVLIGKGSNGYWVDPARAAESLNTRTVRVLSRAPQSDPWEELEDILRAIDWQAAPEHTAKELHNRGVRVIKNGEETA